MKTFLKRDDGLLYRQGGEWVSETANTLAFATADDAERFRRAERLAAVHAVSRLEPELTRKIAVRAPGVYQSGE
ncbi:MAG TPA: hypothetical protein VK846_14720 [Candidatus Limnocylindria bacterium]|nr:hypothetical protein [Candidatus Limnocylindria bacterium]